MRFWERPWAGAAVVAIVLAVFAPTLVFGRVDLDDTWLWADDSPLRELSTETLSDVFFELDAKARHAIGADYAPVRDLDVALDMALFGENERGPHATQLALFALSVFGLGALLVRFGLPRHVAWLGALAWAIHPLRVESVAWLSDRKDILAGVFVVACGHAWIRFRSGGARWWPVLGALAAVAAVWCKGTAMVAPAALLALDYFLLPAGRRRWIAAFAIGTAAALAAVPVLLVDRDAGIIATTDAPQGNRVASALGAEGHYALGVALARPVATNYPIQTDGPSSVDLAVGAIAVAGSLALLWRRRPLAMALLAWTWIWFLPIGHLIVPVHIFAADRYAYWWTLGPLVGLVAALDLVPRLRAPLAVLLIGGLAVVTLRAEGQWTSSVELFTRALESNPDDPLAYSRLAMAQDMTMHAKRALATVERGLARFPTHIPLLNSKVFILESMQRHADALATARFASATGAASAKWTLAGLLQHDHLLAEALPLARAAYEKHPELAHYARRYSEIALALGDAGAAVGALRAIAFPLVRDHFELGLALLELGRTAEAERELATALAAAPGLATELAKRRDHWR